MSEECPEEMPGLENKNERQPERLKRWILWRKQKNIIETFTDARQVLRKGQAGLC